MQTRVSGRTIVYEMPLAQGPKPELYDALSASEREELFRLPKAKRESAVFARLLLKLLLKTQTNLKEEEFLFSRDEYGKPFLPARPEIFFNLTHSDLAVAAALSDRPVGIDAERVRPVSDRLLSRCLSEDERNFLSPETRMRQAIRIWTRKEAYAKMLGRGIFIPFSSFSTLTPEFCEQCVTLERDGYFLSVCLETPAPVLFEEKTAETLEEFFSREIMPKKD